MSPLILEQTPEIGEQVSILDFHPPAPKLFVDVTQSLLFTIHPFLNTEHSTSTQAAPSAGLAVLRCAALHRVSVTATGSWLHHRFLIAPQISDCIMVFCFFCSLSVLMEAPQLGCWSPPLLERALLNSFGMMDRYFLDASQGVVDWFISDTQKNIPFPQGMEFISL